MLRYRTQGLLAAGLGFVAACSSPEIKTDLRPAGPPDVLAVLSQSQVDLLEDAVYCRYVNGVLDAKAPGFVGNPLNGGSMVCPPTEAEFHAAGVSNFGFGLRIMFDELLNADRVETLDCDLTGPDGVPDGVTDDPLICAGSLASTQPLTITCTPTGNAAVTLDYTGYYVPNGNRVTFPVGPSIYALPEPTVTQTFPTGTACNVTIKDSVVDKDNVAVEAAQRSVDFKFADLALIGTDPVDGNSTVISPLGSALFVFNAAIDDTTVAATELSLTTADGTPVPFDFDVTDANASGDAIEIFPTGTWRPGDYIASINAGATFSEVNGGTIEFTAAEKTAFSIGFSRIKTTPAASGVIAPNGSLQITFNDTIDPASVSDDEFELVDPSNNQVAFTHTIVTSTGPDALTNDTIQVTPSAPLTVTSGTQRYNLRVKAAAVFSNTGGKNFHGPFTLSFKVM